MGQERADFGSGSGSEVNSPPATTLENKGKFRPRDQTENGFCPDVGGGDGPDVEPSLVYAALICKEMLNLRHVIECGLLSRLFARPVRCRRLRWRCADRGQISESELEARRRFLVRPARIMSIICPYGSGFPHNWVVRVPVRCRIRRRSEPGRDSPRLATASPRCPRAMLFANATATTGIGFRSSIRASQDPFGAPRLDAHRITAVAPMTSNRRMSRRTIFDVFPSFCLPPVECCRGTRPSQAAKSRPRRN